jgi:hypothetical protein
MTTFLSLCIGVLIKALMEFVESKTTSVKVDHAGAGNDKAVNVVEAKKPFSDLMSH